MEAVRPSYMENNEITAQNPEQSQNMNIPPIAIAGLCFFVGFALGSRRRDLITDTGTRIFRHTGALVLDYAVQAFERTRKELA
jgi:hypothetical protein